MKCFNKIYYYFFNKIVKTNYLESSNILENKIKLSK